VSTLKLLPLATLALLLAACSDISPRLSLKDELPPQPPVPLPTAQPTEGSIYAAGSSFALFEDAKAHNVGDIITITLVENTQAKKSATTNTSKSTSTAMTNPTVFGKIIHLNSGLTGSNKFAGEGDSAQSNSLSGALTAVVTDRLPNGNLMVRGDKLLELNQGTETIHVEGMVRPVDIAPDNSVTSDRVALARIVYKGRGALADANAQGWLARFFNSPWFPF
jgi:flagellar L-ring protein precursor FlgH